MLMKRIRKPLHLELEVNGWDVVDIDPNTEWFSEECWHIRSKRQSCGLTVVLNFLVWGEYIWEEKGKPVMAVSASTTPAEYFHPRDDDIAVVFLGDYPFINSKVSPFEECISELMTALDRYRNQIAISSANEVE